MWGGGTGGVYGRSYRDGARHDPSANAWLPMTLDGAPSARRSASATWTGTELVVFGGASELLSSGVVPASGGGVYPPSADAWRSLPRANAPSPRFSHSAVWTGREVVIFGGHWPSGAVLGDGARYDPSTEKWRPIARTGAPSRRLRHTAVWTGRVVLVYGGSNGTRALADGAAYDPDLDVWTPIAPRPAEAGTYFHEAVWTGSEMIVWGGWPAERSGARYAPALDEWRELPREGAPASGAEASMVFTGDAVVIFGGALSSDAGPPSAVSEGARLDLDRGTWTAVPSSVAIEPRALHSAVMLEGALMIWGGQLDGERTLDSGARIELSSGFRRPMTTIGAPSPRFGHAAIATDREMIGNTR